ncbi:MAG: hypothetical protein AAF902_19575 [Chloroflexota bacterium]
MSNSNNKPMTYGQMFWQNAAPALAILVLVVLAEIGAFAYGRYADRFEQEGIVATGIVTAVEQYEAVKITDFYEEFRRIGSNGDIVTLISYDYQDEAGNTYSDEEKSINLEVEHIPKVGSGFEMRYLASDPTVHETRIGHIESNASVMHWMAAAFGALAFGYVIWGAFAARKEFNSTTEKRKRRQAELRTNSS